MTRGLSNAGFDLDLHYGESREQAFLNILTKADVHCRRIECKSDRAAIRTGNVFIEYQQHGRPSGIATTTASYWAIEYDTNCWIFLPTMVLKTIFERAKRDKWRRKIGGDFNNYDGVLIPIEWLVRLKTS